MGLKFKRKQRKTRIEIGRNDGVEIHKNLKFWEVVKNIREG